MGGCPSTAGRSDGEELAKTHALRVLKRVIRYTDNFGMIVFRNSQPTK